MLNSGGLTVSNGMSRNRYISNLVNRDNVADVTDQLQTSEERTAEDLRHQSPADLDISKLRPNAYGPRSAHAGVG